eukprot:5331807-Pyramimonas_sp.AAC.1
MASNVQAESHARPRAQGGLHQNPVVDQDLGRVRDFIVELLCRWTMGLVGALRAAPPRCPLARCARPP